MNLESFVKKYVKPNSTICVWRRRKKLWEGSEYLITNSGTEFYFENHSDMIKCLCPHNIKKMHVEGLVSIVREDDLDDRIHIEVSDKIYINKDMLKELKDDLSNRLEFISGIRQHYYDSAIGSVNKVLEDYFTDNECYGEEKTYEDKRN